MTGLVKYDAARKALAAAKSVDEVKGIRDQWEAIRTYRRISGDYVLEADAAEIRERAERRLGELLVLAKEKKQVSVGQPKKNAAAAEGNFRVKLEDAGISHKLSARAQKKAGIAERAYEAMLDRMRAQIVKGERVPDVLKVSAGPINGARSIMGDRREPPDSADYFPTPPWATRALVEHVLPVLGIANSFDRIWEPACGEGHMAEVLTEYAPNVIATDLYDYGYGTAGVDFLRGGQGDDITDADADWIITNPPFGDAAIEFVLQAHKLSNFGVAMFFRSQWAVEGIERYERVFRDRAPTLFAPFVERVNLCKGRWDPEGTTATAYCWLVWITNQQPRAPFWIPPGCRIALEREGDRERFTSNPVIRKSEYNAKTGEIIDDSAPGEEAA